MSRRKPIISTAPGQEFEICTFVDLTLKSLAALGPGVALLGAGADSGEAKRVMGLDFPNPVGASKAPCDGPSMVSEIR